MADTQQFFTGKLYVPVHMLKLPAEELLWSALPRMTLEEEGGGGGVGRGLRKAVFHTLGSRPGLLQDLSHRCLYSVVNHM